MRLGAVSICRSPNVFGFYRTGERYVDDAETIAEKAAALNLKVSPIAVYSFSENPPNGLILGYTSFTEKQIKAGVKKLARILKE